MGHECPSFLISQNLDSEPDFGFLANKNLVLTMEKGKLPPRGWQKNSSGRT
jgi:hypothetical protein